MFEDRLAAVDFKAGLEGWTENLRKNRLDLLSNLWKELRRRNKFDVKNLESFG